MKSITTIALALWLMAAGALWASDPCKEGSDAWNPREDLARVQALEGQFRAPADEAELLAAQRDLLARAACYDSAISERALAVRGELNHYDDEARAGTAMEAQAMVRSRLIDAALQETNRILTIDASLRRELGSQFGQLAGAKAAMDAELAQLSRSRMNTRLREQDTVSAKLSVLAIFHAVSAEMESDLARIYQARLERVELNRKRNTSLDATMTAFPDDALRAQIAAAVPELAWIGKKAMNSDKYEARVREEARALLRNRR